MPDAAASPDLYRLLVENSLGLMCIHDLEGVLIAVNPAVGESLGYPPEEGLGRNLRDFLALPVRHLFDDYLRRMKAHGGDSGLMRLLARDGSERIWLYRNKLYPRGDAGAWVLGHALDITGRVAAERGLKEAQAELKRAHVELAERVCERTRELEETNQRLRAEIEQRKQMEEELLRARKLESLGVLAGGIAHDFNNFLTVVQGNLAVAQMQLPENDPVKPLLQQTAAVCQRAGSLASQLLTFAKGGTPVRRALSMAALVRDTVELARAGAPVNIQAQFADDLWTGDADADQISHALRNVLLNARDATPEGGLVQVCAENTVLEDRGTGLKPGRYVRITVRDCGAGIPPEVLPRIFDPYFTTKPGASGLGLATAYAIVSKHEGRIWAESEPGVGTVVRIDLPASETPVQEPPPEPVLTRGSGRILVMDDEESLRMLLARILQPLGYDVICARDGAEAIASYEANRAAGRKFDAVLLDLTVRGGMGGLETAARLKEIDPAVKLIVSSGYSDGAVMSDFQRYGFNQRIPKPWTPAQISEVLQQVLRPRDGAE